MEGQPLIEYPCSWEYKIIGKNIDELEDAVKTVVGGDEYILQQSHSSATGKYHCLNLQIVVKSHDHRNLLYEALKKRQGIIFVL